MKWQLFSHSQISCLLSVIKGYVCTIIVLLWIDATPATVLMKLHESWSLLRVKTN